MALGQDKCNRSLGFFSFVKGAVDVDGWKREEGGGVSCDCSVGSYGLGLAAAFGRIPPLVAATFPTCGPPVEVECQLMACAIRHFWLVIVAGMYCVPNSAGRVVYRAPKGPVRSSLRLFHPYLDVKIW
jgi:hypothetical protein